MRTSYVKFLSQMMAGVARQGRICCRTTGETSEGIFGRRARVVVLGLIAVLVVAACSGETDEPTANVASSSSTLSVATASTFPETTTSSTVPATTTTLAPRTVGLDWTDQRIDLPDGFQFWDVEEALGQLWIVGGFGQVRVLLASSDGEEWETVDPGWDEQIFVSRTTNETTSVLLSESDSDLKIAAFFRVPGSESCGEDGRTGDLWIYQMDGSTWNVRAPEETGFDAMPPGDRDFRIKGLSGITRDGDTIVAVGSGQWWKPYETSDFSFAAISSLPDGQWKVFGEDSPLFGGGAWQSPSGIATVDGLFVPAGWHWLFGDNTTQEFASWVSPDGVAWTANDRLVAPDVLDSVVVSVASTPAGVLAAGYEEPPPFPIVENETRVQKPVAWFSPDGTSSTRVVLAQEEGSADAILAVGDTFYVVGEVEREPTVWESPDGFTFEIIDANVPAFQGDESTTSWRGGIAGVILPFMSCLWLGAGSPGCGSHPP